MQYMLLIYTDEKAWTEQERQTCYADSTELCKELATEGKFVSASPLEPVETASSLRVRNGKVLLTDGPFAETYEQLGGYFMVDVASKEEAIAIAARIPGARKGTVEVRPVIALPGLP